MLPPDWKIRTAATVGYAYAWIYLQAQEFSINVQRATRWVGVTIVMSFASVVFYIAVTDTIPKIPASFCYPVADVIHPQYIGYLVAVILMFMTTSSMLLFHLNERKNRVSHWRNHPLVQAAITNNPIEHMDKYKTELSSEELSTTRVTLQCPACMVETTSRAHHCPICDKCVLRRDHHCFVTSACIGLGNQRFFVNLAIWCLLSLLIFLLFEVGLTAASCYSNLNMNLLFFGRTGNFSSLFDHHNWAPEMQPPKQTEEEGEPSMLAKYHSQLAFLLGTVTECLHVEGATNFYNGAKMMTVLLSCGNALVALIFIVHLNLSTIYGMTHYEFSHLDVQMKLYPDGSTVAKRMELVYGRRWLLNMIIPNIWDDNVLTEETAVNLFRPKSKQQ